MADEKVIYSLALKDAFSDGIVKAKRETDKLDGSVNKVGSSLKSLAVGAAAAFAGVGLYGFLSDSVAMYDEAAKATAQLDAAIISTGGAAGITTEQLEAQAAALQKVTLYDDDATKSAQALLLTFTKVSGELYNQAIPAIQDLATATGTDLKGASIQVGKALNDPIRGITALRRVGVSFSDAQVDVIKNLVETNRLADAQSLILKELQTEFGGSAEAAAKAGTGGLTIMKNELNDVREELGALVVGFIYQLKPAIQLAIDAFRGFVGFLQGSIKFIQENKEELAILALGIIAYATYVSAATIAMYGLSVATKIATAVQWLFNAALTANPIGLVIAGVAALTAGIVYAWKHFEGFRGAVMGAWQVLKDLGGFIQNFFIKQLSGIGNVIAGIFTFDLDLIKQGLTQAVDAYTDFGKDAAVSFAKGYQNGVDSFAKDNKEETKSVLLPKTAIAANEIGDTAGVVKSEAASGKTTGKPQQGKATTINITIEKLVEKFEIQTTNINESAGKVKDMVQRALISALNDSQIVAGK